MLPDVQHCYSQCLSRRRWCSWWQIWFCCGKPWWRFLRNRCYPRQAIWPTLVIARVVPSFRRVVDCSSEAFGKDPVLKVSKDDDGDALIDAETPIGPYQLYRTDGTCTCCVIVGSGLTRHHHTPLSLSEFTVHPKRSTCRRNIQQVSGDQRRDGQYASVQQRLWQRDASSSAYQNVFVLLVSEHAQSKAVRKSSKTATDHVRDTACLAGQAQGRRKCQHRRSS